MFQMFGFGGVKCPRCERKSTGDSGYCSHCGMTLSAPRNAAVLRENRWIPADNELAVFFGVADLDGLFIKTLHVPATTRAYILQGYKATEVPQGEYEIEGFFKRLNHLLRDDHAEILITRSNALPVSFEFDDLQTAELLKVSAAFTVSVKVDQLPAFGQHFMTAPGAVTTEHLRDLLAPSVRQLAAEFVASQSIRDMCSNRDLRPQLDERLQGALKLRLAQFGLAVVQVDTLALRHDQYDANRERIGSLWLVADERHVQLEHRKQLDDIYNDEQWQQIVRDEHEARLRHRRGEMRQDERVENLQLSLQEAERVQALRAREIDLYGRFLESKSRKDAIARGAAETLAELEHELAKKGVLREDESVQWGQLRQLAQIRMQGELELARQDATQQSVMAQQRFSHQLLQQQIANKIEQALAIEDEGHKRAELARLRATERAALDHAANMEAEHHLAALKSLQLAHAGQRRATERVQEWEEQLDLDRKRELLRADQLKDTQSQVQVEEVRQQLDALRRSGARQDSIAQHEKLLRTIEADGIHSRQEASIALEAEQQRHTMRQQEHQLQWQHELATLQTLGTMKADQISALAQLRAAVHDKQPESGTEKL